MQLLFVKEIAPPQPFLKSYPVTFLGVAKAIRYSVNIALNCLMPFADVTLFKTGLKGLLTKFRSIEWIVVFHDRLLFRDNAHTVYSKWRVSKWSRLMPFHFHLPFCFLLRWMTELSDRQTVYLSWHFCCLSSYGIKPPLIWPETWLFSWIPLALIYELVKEITYVWDRLEQTLSSDNQLPHFLLLEWTKLLRDLKWIIISNF